MDEGRVIESIRFTYYHAGVKEIGAQLIYPEDARYIDWLGRKYEGKENTKRIDRLKECIEMNKIIYTKLYNISMEALNEKIKSL